MIEERSKTKKFHNFDNYKAEILNNKSKYNIFFLFIIQENYIQDISMAIFNVEGKGNNISFINYNFRILIRRPFNIKERPFFIFLIHTPMENQKEQILISVLMKNKYYYSNNNYYYKSNYYYKDNYYLKEKEYTSSISRPKEYENYFLINNLKYEQFNDFFTIKTNSIFNIFLCYFFDKKIDIEYKYKKRLLESLIQKISSEKVELTEENILMFFKLCSKNNFKINNICGLQILKLQKKGNPLNPEYYLLAEDIDNLNLEKNRNDFIKIIVNIYAIYDTKYLMN